MRKGSNNARAIRDRSAPSVLEQRGIIEDRVIGIDISAVAEERVDRAIVLAFAPLHKAAFGAALGIVSGTVFALVTLGDMWLDPQRRAGLDLFGEYFYGYTVSPSGIIIGFFWAAAVGFVGGWFLAFARNAIMALWVLYFRLRADWLATGDFLDYI